MHPTILAVFSGIAPIVLATCSCGIALFLIGAWAAKKDVASARGLDKIVALSNLCFAAPLAVFSAEHFSDPGSMLSLVPRYMPWRMFWVYFVGCALLAAALSIATKIAVHWSGLLVGLMMFLFVAMLYFPSSLRNPDNRIVFTIVFRETSFGGGAWLLAASAAKGWRDGPVKSMLFIVGLLCVATTAIVFGIEHFRHPLGLPGVPLQKEMPAWVPGRKLIDYVTGAGLVVAGPCFLLSRKMRRAAATYLGTWLLLTIIVIYGPVMILALRNPATAVQLEGINYFFDTLLFTGAILAVASATPRSDSKAG